MQAIGMALASALRMLADDIEAAARENCREFQTAGKLRVHGSTRPPTTPGMVMTGEEERTGDRLSTREGCGPVALASMRGTRDRNGMEGASAHDSRPRTMIAITIQIAVLRASP